jgi:hypothetical protein
MVGRRRFGPPSILPRITGAGGREGAQGGRREKGVTVMSCARKFNLQMAAVRARISAGVCMQKAGRRKCPLLV